MDIFKKILSLFKKNNDRVLEYTPTEDSEEFKDSFGMMLLVLTLVITITIIFAWIIYIIIDR